MRQLLNMLLLFVEFSFPSDFLLGDGDVANEQHF